MGLIVDTSNLVTAERRGRSVPELLEEFQRAWGETRIGLSAITIVEFAHGIERATAEGRGRRRKAFLEELRASMAVYPLTDEIAELAGTIAGRQAQRGVVLPLADRQPRSIMAAKWSQKTSGTSK